jgi:curved DNA-binding protein CbpA
MKDYYKVLGVDKTATVEEIKKRFREKALVIHPDKSGRDTRDEFIELYEAYEILADKKKRERYDKLYDLIETTAPGQKDYEFTNEVLRVREKASAYADNLKKFDKEVMALILIDLFLAPNSLVLSSLAAMIIGVWTMGRGILKLQFDYSLIGLLLMLAGIFLAKVKLDRIRKYARR